MFSSSSSGRASAISPYFLSLFLSPYLSCSCLSGGNGAGSKYRQQRHYSSSCFVVANVHRNNSGQLRPKHRQLYRRKRLPGSVKLFGSESSSFRGVRLVKTCCFYSKCRCVVSVEDFLQASLFNRRRSRAHDTEPHALRLRDVIT